MKRDNKPYGASGGRPRRLVGGARRLTHPREGAHACGRQGGLQTGPDPRDLAHQWPSDAAADHARWRAGQQRQSQPLRLTGSFEL